MDIEALRYRLSSFVYENEAGENDALAGYMKLAREFVDEFSKTPDNAIRSILQSAIEDILEICSDEKNHKLILQKIENNLDMILISADGADAALKNIADHVDKA